MTFDGREGSAYKDSGQLQTQLIHLTRGVWDGFDGASKVVFELKYDEETCILHFKYLGVIDMKILVPREKEPFVKELLAQCRSSKKRGWVELKIR